MRLSRFSLCLLLALLTAGYQFWYVQNEYGGRYIDSEQVARSQAVVDHTQAAPYRYRLLSDSIFIHIYQQVIGSYALEWRGKHYVVTPAVLAAGLLRVIQNLLIFLLAGYFYLQLKLTPRQVTGGLLLAAYAMCSALYQSDLGFSSYTEIICFLGAAIFVGGRRYLPFLAITAIAALNRESSVLLPLLWLIHAVKLPKLRVKVNSWRDLWLAAGALALFVAIYAAIYWHVGSGPYSGSRYGKIHPGPLLLWLNLTNARTWFGLVVMAFPVAMLALLARSRKMPEWARIWAVVFVLPWTGAMLVCGSADETRLFLLPLILWAVPVTLLSLPRKT